LGTILTEGVAHRLYKFDIKGFFENIDTSALATQIALDSRIPCSAALLVSKYFSRLQTLGIVGIPRGIPLSATLSEYVLQQFDAYVSQLPEVYYYARYVDDIVIVTGAREEQPKFERLIGKKLPRPLSFNSMKTRLLDIPTQRPSVQPNKIGDFDYLGYNLAVYEPSRNRDNRLTRQVDVTIASKKLKRLKSRLCCALLHFTKTKNFDTLRRRLQLLTGNYNIRDISTGQLRNVGLYCNYRRVNKYDGLKNIDAFLVSTVIGSRSRLAKRFAAAATPVQRRSLLRFSFAISFNRRTFYNFRGDELNVLARCWRNA
jgi:hypothetical protein